jgi:hypothetical protein
MPWQDKRDEMEIWTQHQNIVSPHKPAKFELHWLWKRPPNSTPIQRIAGCVIGVALLSGGAALFDLEFRGGEFFGVLIAVAWLAAGGLMLYRALRRTPKPERPRRV